MDCGSDVAGVSITRSFISKCEARSGGGLRLFRPRNLVIQFCNLSQCQAVDHLQEHVGPWGSGIALSWMPADCKATYSASCLDNNNAQGSITSSNLLFAHGECTQANVICSSVAGDPDISFFSCLFISNIANSTRKGTVNGTPMNMALGNDIMFHYLPVWERILKDKSSFVNCFSTSDFPRIALQLTPLVVDFSSFSDGKNTLLDIHLPTLGIAVSAYAGNVVGSGDPFAILHTICARFGIAPKSISIDPRHQSNPSLFIHLFSALFTYLPNSTNFHLLPLFTTILQRHPPSLPHLLSSPLWLSLPSILASPPQSPSTLQTQPQPSPQPSPHNEPQIEEQSHLRPVLAFVNSILQLSLTSSPPTPIPNKTLLSSSLSTLSSHPDPLVKVHSGSTLHFLTLLDGVVDETSMPVDELVAQREALFMQIKEKEGIITQLTISQDQMKETMSSKDNTITQELQQAQTEVRKTIDRMAEMTRQLEGKNEDFQDKRVLLNTARTLK
ncbi:hypothetical protein BLNAU_17131 [Blattamonas nauphoetae]|uniref:Uncharacterized protein n=1 Tax=Blattamonas nauphoetae TaxID=2049346 RepID=A0ABQ9XAM0_9EUKA|nr:hypothetical protein BLNAU_17131 [Blattamonas nauphoetae]